MIGKLTGIIDSFGENSLILDCGGVGYVVYASGRTLSSIGQKGAPASLLIETHVREDHINLYGFADRAEQEWFRLLTSVQGVGAKVGLAILSACAPDRLGFMIAAQDSAALRQADGVGPKLATRIVTELKDKAGKMDLQIVPPKAASKKPGGKAEPAAPEPRIDQDAVSALVNLGYARSDAFAAVVQARLKANDNEQGDLQALIRLALKELSA